MFSVHTTPVEFKNTRNTGYFGFVFEKNTGREITWLPWRHRFWIASLHPPLMYTAYFRNAPFSKCFLSTRTDEKTALSSFSGLKSVFEEHRFRNWLLLTVGLPWKQSCVLKFLRSNVDAALVTFIVFCLKCKFVASVGVHFWVKEQLLTWNGTVSVKCRAFYLTGRR